MTTAALERSRETPKTAGFSSVVNETMVRIGERLRLYESLAEIGPASASKLAAARSISARLVHQWLTTQSAAGYLYSYGDGRYGVACPLPERRS